MAVGITYATSKLSLLPPLLPSISGFLNWLEVYQISTECEYFMVAIAIERCIIMDNSIGLIYAYQLSVGIIEMSLELIDKWECDTTILEEILRLNHRGWELFFKASCFIFSEKVPANSNELKGHRLSLLLPKLRLNYDKQNLNQLFQSKMFRDYFVLLDDLFSDLKSRYNVINDLFGEDSEHYVVDSWIKAQKLNLGDNMYENIRQRILEINNITLRCFYMNMTSVHSLRGYSVVLQKWSGYYHNWFSKMSIE